MNQKGQSLVEAIVALGVAVIIVSAIAVAVIAAVNNADYSKYQNQATDYAQSELETLNQQSKTDWPKFSTFNSTYCIGENVTPGNTNAIACPGPNLPSSPATPIFMRQVDINKNSCGAGISKVHVSVSWTDGKCPSNSFCHQVDLYSCFTNI